MSRKIIINKTVIFEPDKKLIIGKKDTVRLSASATLCMELLIEKAGELVTHQQLYDFAWRRFGMEPTATSLYQNISNLRRALTCAGLKDETIRTMPRRGFILSPRTEITRENHQRAAICADIESTQNIQMVGEKNPARTEHANDSSTERKKQSCVLSQWMVRRPLFLCLTALLVVVLTQISIFFRPPTDNVKNYFTPLMNQSSDCHVFVNSDNGLSKIRMDNAINNLISNCLDHAYLYITTYNNSERTSVISCQNALGTRQRANCHSYYFIEHITSD